MHWIRDSPHQEMIPCEVKTGVHIGKSGQARVFAFPSYGRGWAAHNKLKQ